jgi:hypothetical protein
VLSKLMERVTDEFAVSASAVVGSMVQAVVGRLRGAPGASSSPVGPARPHGGDLMQGRSRILEAIDTALSQVRSTPSATLSLLVFQVSELEDYKRSDLERALRETVQAGDIFGLAERRNFVVGLRDVPKTIARSELARMGRRLLEVVDPAHLSTGLSHETAGTRSAHDMYLDAKLHDLTPFDSQREREVLR